MENMDKGLTVPKSQNGYLLIVWPKITQMPQNLPARFVCPSPKVLDLAGFFGDWSLLNDSKYLNIKKKKNEIETY
jgi:hypothetical protein